MTISKKENHQGEEKMKKILSVFTLLAIMITLVSCASPKNTNPIDFGKKYSQNEDQYYVFEKDGTGYCEYYKKNDSYVQSGKVDFVWREASNGAVYLFRTETSYNDDHTEGKFIPLIDDPIYFSEDFFTYSYSTQHGGTTINYIKEGSKLEKLMEE